MPAFTAEVRGRNRRWFHSQGSRYRLRRMADYTCEYDGEDLGDGFCTHDVDEALDWLFGVRKSNYQKHYFYFASGENVKSICFYTSEDAWEFVKEYASCGYDCVVERYI